MIGGHQVPPQIEQITNRGVSTQESLSWLFTPDISSYTPSGILVFVAGL